MAVNNKVRVRFAPSPTGQLHVGNVRTALYNWLFARQQGGKFMLRIEDTDLERSEARYEAQLMEDLRWLGWIGRKSPEWAVRTPPTVSRSRMEIYQRYRKIDPGKQSVLLFLHGGGAGGGARRAWRTKHRFTQADAGSWTRRKPEQAARGGRAARVRLKIPEHPIRFHDIVRGEVEFSDEAVSDPIIVRSSGMPVYNYVVVVDDAHMKITHVIRATTIFPTRRSRWPSMRRSAAGAGVCTSFHDPGQRP